MALEKKPVILAWDIGPKDSSFIVVLDTACERLREKQVQYSIRRIREMDEELGRLEKELDEFLGSSVNHDKTE